MAPEACDTACQNARRSSSQICTESITVYDGDKQLDFLDGCSSMVTTTPVPDCKNFANGIDCIDPATEIIGKCNDQLCDLYTVQANWGITSRTALSMKCESSTANNIKLTLPEDRWCTIGAFGCPDMCSDLKTAKEQCNRIKDCVGLSCMQQNTCGGANGTCGVMNETEAMTFSACALRYKPSIGRASTTQVSYHKNVGRSALTPNCLRYTFTPSGSGQYFPLNMKVFTATSGLMKVKTNKYLLL